MERFFRNIKAFTITAAIVFAAVMALMGISYLISGFRLNETIPASVSAASSGQEHSGDEGSKPEEPASQESDPEDEPEPDGSEDRHEPEGSASQESPSQEESETDGSGDLHEPEGSASQVSEPEDHPEPDGLEELAPPPANEAVQAARRGKPDEMRGVYLTPGTDYPVDADKETMRAGIANALSKAKNLTMNTVFAELAHQDGVIYKAGGAEPVHPDADILQLILDEARARDFYVYAVFDASRGADEQGAARDAGALAGKYAVDGVLIDGYENPSDPDSYARYTQSQSGSSYQTGLRERSQAMFRSVSEALREHGSGIQVGILVNGVWENTARDETGSDTAAQRTQMHDGNADTKRWITEGYADFVAFRPNGATDSATEPFKTAAAWWAALSDEAGIPFYVLHRADLNCTDTTGYRSPDELAQQVIYARACAGFQGSVYNSLSRLAENPQASTDLLMKLYNGQVNVSHVLTRLAVTQPDQSAFSTFEPTASFRGASDPNFEVKLDGETLDTDDNGIFSVTKDLAPGANQFTFEHKGKTQAFTITRNVQIIKEVTPSGNVGLEGGMRLSVSALAYADASVTASLGGETITLLRDDTVDDDSDAGSAYKRFTGSFAAPAASAKIQGLGSIVVSGTWEGVSDSKQGASVSVNAVVPAGDGDLVVVTADSAKTFPTNVLNNESDPAYFPLPKGTLDYMASEKLSFTNSSGTYYYYKLQSGLRVYAEDVSRTTGGLSLNNAISSMDISSDKRFTYVALKTAQHVPYRVRYTGGAITFDFQYTSQVPGSQKVKGNPVIKSADWSGSQLTLQFVRSGSFLGYYAYYKDDDTLVLRLTNPPASVGGVRIAIDPGHGGKDPGAPGYYTDVSEAEINQAIAEKTAQALRDRGASVKLIQNDPFLSLWQRVDEAAAYDADIFISIHANSLDNNSTTTGTEVYYFYPNAQILAASIASRVSSALDAPNRGAKSAQYVVTSDVRFASVLVETGFISNKGEYNKLTKGSYQNEVAQAIADGVSAYIGAVSTGIAGGDGEPDEDEDGGDVDPGDTRQEEGEGDPLDSAEAGASPDPAEEVTGIQLDKTDITLNVSESYKFKVLLEPENAKNQKVRWESDDEAVASVSAAGKVSAVGAGKAVVTVTSDDGGHTATCIVRVNNG